MVLTQPMPVISQGCDWLTCSSPDLSLYEFARERQHAQFISKPFASYGYRGFEERGLRAGRSQDGASLVQLSGERARLEWQDFYKQAENCSRFDGQVTCRLPKYDPDVAKALGNILFSHQEEVRAKRGPLKMPLPTLINGYGQGDTLYIGSRSSDQCARIYDKQKESGELEYENCWRFEIEFKNGLARLAAKTIMVSELRDGYAMRRMVQSWLAKRGLAVQFQGGEKELVLPSSYEPTELDAKLYWLEHQVAPTVQKLRVAGLAENVIQSLGLQHYLAELLDYIAI